MYGRNYGRNFEVIKKMKETTMEICKNIPEKNAKKFLGSVRKFAKNNFHGKCPKIIENV